SCGYFAFLALAFFAFFSGFSFAFFATFTTTGVLAAIREIVGFGDGLIGRLLMIDARAMRFETLRYGRDPANPLNGDGPVVTDLNAHRT
ncbi:hypothetical protein MOV75_37220, partial [Bradyrhizobium sp. PRIMUS42]|nr:hypothetical protein [Bradyrhizobium sp. PRIMUS42]